jgi:glycopeptide antibiotics resistance protein
MSKFRIEMKVSFAILLAAMGMIGLALLNVTQWARVNISVSNSLFQFLLGVLPNVAAGYAMPLILASFMPKVVKNTNKGEARKVFFFVSIFTTLGLIVWEFIQIDSKNLYFDINDIVATFIGVLLAFLVYVWLSKLKISNEQDTYSQTVTKNESSSQQ